MSIEAIDIVALEALLTREPTAAPKDEPKDLQAEHPLTAELRGLLQNPGAHRVGDLARVVDSIMQEMSMYKAAHGLKDEPGA